jgi:hypothetical protein
MNSTTMATSQLCMSEMAPLEWAKPTWPQSCPATMAQPMWAFCPKVETVEPSPPAPPSPIWPHWPIGGEPAVHPGRGSALEG